MSKDGLYLEQIISRIKTSPDRVVSSPCFPANRKSDVHCISHGGDHCPAWPRSCEATHHLLGTPPSTSGAPLAPAGFQTRSLGAIILFHMNNPGYVLEVWESGGRGLPQGHELVSPSGNVAILRWWDTPGLDGGERNKRVRVTVCHVGT